jgi:hypothetical protein
MRFVLRGLSYLFFVMTTEIIDADVLFSRIYAALVRFRAACTRGTAPQAKAINKGEVSLRENDPGERIRTSDLPVPNSTLPLS